MELFYFYHSQSFWPKFNEFKDFFEFQSPYLMTKKNQKSQLKNAIIVSRFCHVFIIISYRKLLLIFIFYLIDIFIILKHTVAFFYNLGTTLS